LKSLLLEGGPLGLKIELKEENGKKERKEGVEF
jgi:hypothetical protein